MTFGAGCVLLAALLGGCETSPRAASGELPEGYESWEEYAKVQDQMQREAERAGDRHRLTHPTGSMPRW